MNHIESFAYHLNKAFEYANNMGVSNPLDKSKWREMIMANKLNHDLFAKASGGKDNNETYGADALSNGIKCEYKTATMSDKQYNDFKQGKLKKQYSMVYNGAYNHESIDRYNGIEQFLGLFYKSECVIIVKVPHQDIINKLHENLDYTIERANKTGKNPTTNCNSFMVSFENNIPHIGEII